MQAIFTVVVPKSVGNIAGLLLGKTLSVELLQAVRISYKSDV